MFNLVYSIFLPALYTLETASRGGGGCKIYAEKHHVKIQRSNRHKSITTARESKGVLPCCCVFSCMLHVLYRLLMPHSHGTPIPLENAMSPDVGVFPGSPLPGREGFIFLAHLSRAHCSFSPGRQREQRPLCSIPPLSAATRCGLANLYTLR